MSGQRAAASRASARTSTGRTARGKTAADGAPRSTAARICSSVSPRNGRAPVRPSHIATANAN